MTAAVTLERGGVIALAIPAGRGHGAVPLGQEHAAAPAGTGVAGRADRPGRGLAGLSAVLVVAAE